MYTMSVIILLMPWVYESCRLPVAQHLYFPAYPKFQFFSKGAQPNIVKAGARKLKAVTIAIDIQMII